MNENRGHLGRGCDINTQELTGGYTLLQPKHSLVLESRRDGINTSPWLGNNFLTSPARTHTINIFPTHEMGKDLSFITNLSLLKNPTGSFT